MCVYACDAQHAVCEYLRDVVRRRLLGVVLRQLLCLVRRLVEHLSVAVADEVLRQVLEVCHHPLLVEVAHVRDPVQQLGFLRVQLEVALCGGVLGVRRMATECAWSEVERGGSKQGRRETALSLYLLLLLLLLLSLLGLMMMVVVVVMMAMMMVVWMCMCVCRCR